jgi:hypothetical protein
MEWETLGECGGGIGVFAGWMIDDGGVYERMAFILVGMSASCPLNMCMQTSFASQLSLVPETPVGFRTVVPRRLGIGTGSLYVMTWREAVEADIQRCVTDQPLIYPLARFIFPLYTLLSSRSLKSP